MQTQTKPVRAGDERDYESDLLGYQLISEAQAPPYFTVPYHAELKLGLEARIPLPKVKETVSRGPASTP